MLLIRNLFILKRQFKLETYKFLKTLWVSAGYKTKKSHSFLSSSHVFWVEDGARTHDPRYHKPML
jgi:hypothetical protein